jgi:uncharacterized membrane protein YhaH (DUF805 family)
MTLTQFYLSAQGRANRKQFWLWLVLPFFIIGVVLTVIDNMLGTYDPERGIGTLSGIFSILALVPIIMVEIKRFHDRDKTGWWVLISLVPIIGAIWILVELGFLAGTPGPNRFGPPVGDPRLAMAV